MALSRVSRREGSVIDTPDEFPLRLRERWKKNIQRAKYYIPSINWMTHYSVANLSGDVVAGLTVSSVLIPQSISYAASLGRLSPAAGLLCGSFPAIVYAFLGTSRQLNVGPTAAVSLLVGKALSDVRQRLLSVDPDFDWENERYKIGMAVATMITLQVVLPVPLPQLLLFDTSLTIQCLGRGDILSFGPV
jgi:hypothetical protein